MGVLIKWAVDKPVGQGSWVIRALHGHSHVNIILILIDYLEISPHALWSCSPPSLPMSSFPCDLPDKKKVHFMGSINSLEHGQFLSVQLPKGGYLFPPESAPEAISWGQQPEWCQIPYNSLHEVGLARVVLALTWLKIMQNLVLRRQCLYSSLFYNCFQLYMSFCQLDTNCSHLRRNLKWCAASIRLAYEPVCGTFSWVIIDMGEPSPLWVVPGLARRIRKQAKQATEASRQAPFLHGLSFGFCSTSRFLPWVSAFTSHDDGLWWASIGQINPFLLR